MSDEKQHNRAAGKSAGNRPAGAENEPPGGVEAELCAGAGSDVGPCHEGEAGKEGAEVTRAELRYIVARHEKWLRHPDSGERADLREANLQGADLREANLQEANLQGADLQKANLRKANLRGTDLWEANLQGADLDYASWPLWCGSLKAKADDRLIIQLLFHTISLAQQSDISDQLRTALDTDNLVEQANRFHRAGECGPLGRWPEEENNHERTTTEAEPV